MERLGALLREARESAGLLQRDLAKALGRPQQYVSQYETGGHRLDIWELGEVSRALGLPLGEVVRRYEAAAGRRAGPRSAPRR